MEIDRRTFVKGGIGALTTLYIPGIFPGHPHVQYNLSDIYGLHGIADVNAAGKEELTVSDAVLLSAKQLHIIEPSVKFMQLAKKYGIRITTRVHLPGNNYHDNSQFLKENLSHYDQVDEGPTDQIGNEVDKEMMKNTRTGINEHIDLGNFMDAHWFPAGEKVWDRRGIILTPPLAQQDKKNKAAYAKEMDGYRVVARKLKEKTTHEQRLQGVGIGTRGYIFYPDQDPFEHVADVQEVFRSELGYDYPVYVTEAGVSENVGKFTYEEIARLTTTTLSLRIPKDQRAIAAWDFWLHGGSGLRNLSEDYKKKNRWWLDRDDKVAWRINEEQVNPVFTAVEEMMHYETPKRNLTIFNAQKLSRRLFFLGRWRATS